MKIKMAAIFAMTFGLLIISAPLLAHHGTAAYDYARTVNLKATITGFVWANPHCQIEFDAKDEGGNAQHWIIEAFNPAMLQRDGWTKGRESMKPGDEVTVSFHPSKNGEKVGILDKVTLASGQVLRQHAAQSQAPGDAPYR
jgi:hypothetical protein